MRHGDPRWNIRNRSVSPEHNTIKIYIRLFHIWFRSHSYSHPQRSSPISGSIKYLKHINVSLLLVSSSLDDRHTIVEIEIRFSTLNEMREASEQASKQPKRYGIEIKLQFLTHPSYINSSTIVANNRPPLPFVPSTVPHRRREAHTM